MRLWRGIKWLTLCNWHTVRRHCSRWSAPQTFPLLSPHLYLFTAAISSAALCKCGILVARELTPTKILLSWGACGRNHLPEGSLEMGRWDVLLYFQGKEKSTFWYTLNAQDPIFTPMIKEARGERKEFPRFACVLLFNQMTHIPLLSWKEKSLRLNISFSSSSCTKSRACCLHRSAASSKITLSAIVSNKEKYRAHCSLPFSFSRV